MHVSCNFLATFSKNLQLLGNILEFFPAIFKDNFYRHLVASPNANSLYSYVPDPLVLSTGMELDVKFYLKYYT